MGAHFTRGSSFLCVLLQALETSIHPLSELVNSLVDAFLATYVGVGSHLRLLHHAVGELKSYISRLYQIIRLVVYSWVIFGIKKKCLQQYFYFMVILHLWKLIKQVGSLMGSFKVWPVKGQRGIFNILFLSEVIVHYINCVYSWCSSMSVFGWKFIGKNCFIASVQH